jgi:uncharacterized RDD family membrane protein YckC
VRRADEKKPVLLACPKCGAANSETAEVCYVCDAALIAHTAGDRTPFSTEDALEPVAVSSSEPEWRLEVAHRLEAYRARRRRTRGTDESQTNLPFAGGSEPVEGDPTRANDPRLTPGSSTGQARERHRRVDIEIAVLQPALDFTAREEPAELPATALVPVAELSERLRAAWFDIVFLIASYGGFLFLFGSLGGQFSLGKYDAAVYGVTLFLFYVQYFGLFTSLNGSTPGMGLCGLRVVSFDGTEPTASQLLWRSFGYLVSAGTLCLGFLWSLWDEDHLTWQDRISQTYITHTPPAEDTGDNVRIC